MFFYLVLLLMNSCQSVLATELKKQARITMRVNDFGFLIKISYPKRVKRDTDIVYYDNRKQEFLGTMSSEALPLLIGSVNYLGIILHNKDNEAALATMKIFSHNLVSLTFKLPLPDDFQGDT